MRLSDLPLNSLASQVLRDAEFDGLGYLGHRPNSSREIVFCGDAKFRQRLNSRGGIAAVVCPAELASIVPSTMGVIAHSSPADAFFDLHTHLAETGFYGMSEPTRIHPTASIHPTAVIAERGVIVGEDASIGPHVILHEGSSIGARTIIRDGTVVGSEGFEFKRLGGKLVPIRHMGGVHIGADCELQSHCAVDKALFGGATVIGDGCKLDNFVHIAHGVVLGEGCLLAACVMLAGAVVVGSHVRIDPNSSIGHEVTIGDRAYISMGAVVGADVNPGQRVSGTFAVDHSLAMRLWAALRSGRLLKR